MDAILVTIPFSHFCEKARWALDRAAMPYVEEGHVPGLHRIAVRRAGSPRTSVPVLVAGSQLVVDSTHILSYVDSTLRPEHRLFPENPATLAETQALVADLDERLGVHLRRVLYFSLLPRRDLVLGLFDQCTPTWERAAVRLLFPALRAAMRRFMQIAPDTAASSVEEVRRVLDAMDARLSDGRPYLMGDRFTAADVTLAALAAPCVDADERAVRYPDVDALPEPARRLVRELRTRPVAAHVRRMYREQRRCPSGSPMTRA